MNERELSGFFNSSLIFDQLFKNKTILTAYLEDGTKLSGRLLGWDVNYLLILYGKTLQIIPAAKLIRLQAELENVSPAEAVAPEAFEAPVIPEPSKPKFTLEPEEGTEIKDQLMAEKAQNETNKDKPPAKDRLDHLVKNW
jgi:hypothetical protein